MVRLVPFVVALPLCGLACAEGAVDRLEFSADRGDAAPSSPGMVIPDVTASTDDDHDGLVCHGYTFDPAPTETSCEYLLPSGPSPNGDPRLEPSNMQLTRARIFTIDQAKTPWNEGPYRARPSDCEDKDGWYAIRVDGGPPTRFAICPKSCDAVTAGALLRLDVPTYCEPAR